MTDQLTMDQWLKDARKRPSANPMVVSHGLGPHGRKCHECRFFIRKSEYSKTYFKCSYRGNTNGPGTDHRANWEACANYMDPQIIGPENPL